MWQTLRVPVTAGIVCAIGVGLLGTIVGAATERPLYGGDGSVARSIVVITIVSFVGATVGILIGRVLHQRSSSAKKS
jgi:hypothetical protein